MQKGIWLTALGLLVSVALPAMALEVAYLQHHGHPQADLWLQLPDGRILRATQPYAEDLPVWLEHRATHVVLHVDGGLPAGNYRLGVSRWFSGQPLLYRLALSDGRILEGVYNDTGVVDWLLMLTASELSTASGQWLRTAMEGQWIFGSATGSGFLRIQEQMIWLSWLNLDSNDCRTYRFDTAAGLPGGLRSQPVPQLHRSLLLEVLEPEDVQQQPFWLPLTPASAGQGGCDEDAGVYW